MKESIYGWKSSIFKGICREKWLHKSNSTPIIGNWVDRRRFEYKEGKLSQERIELIELSKGGRDCRKKSYKYCYNRKDVIKKLGKKES